MEALKEDRCCRGAEQLSHSVSCTGVGGVGANSHSLTSQATQSQLHFVVEGVSQPLWVSGGGQAVLSFISGTGKFWRKGLCELERASIVLLFILQEKSK